MKIEEVTNLVGKMEHIKIVCMENVPVFVCLFLCIFKRFWMGARNTWVCSYLKMICLPVSVCMYTHLNRWQKYVRLYGYLHVKFLSVSMCMYKFFNGCQEYLSLYSYLSIICLSVSVWVYKYLNGCQEYLSLYSYLHMTLFVLWHSLHRTSVVCVDK